MSELFGAHPVEVVEGGSELVELLLADALGVTGQDLVLDFVDGSGDGGEQLLPAHADVLQRGDSVRNWTVVADLKEAVAGRTSME